MRVETMMLVMTGMGQSGFLFAYILCEIHDKYKREKERRRQRTEFAVFRSESGKYFVRHVKRLPNPNPNYTCIVYGVTKEYATKFSNECENVKEKYGNV